MRWCARMLDPPLCYHGSPAGASVAGNRPTAEVGPVSSPRIECTGIRFRYGGPDVLRRVDLAVDAGEVLGLVGPNGSGKSTLLMVLAGLLAPAEGQVQLDGRPLDRLDRRAIARHLAYLPQQFEQAFPFTALRWCSAGAIPTSRGSRSRGARIWPSPGAPWPGWDWRVSRTAGSTSCRGGSGSAR